MKTGNKTKYVILGLLTIEPMSGYDIKMFVQKSIAYFWAESNGQIYPTLNQLAKEGLIEISEIASKGKKKRNIYAITEKGQHALQKWMREKDEKFTYRDENLLKLFFGKNISKKECIRLLKNRKKKLLENLAEYTSIAGHLQKETDSPHQLYWLLTAKNGISSVEAEINWCEESIKTLEGK